VIRGAKRKAVGRDTLRETKMCRGEDPTKKDSKGCAGPSSFVSEAVLGDSANKFSRLIVDRVFGVSRRSLSKIG
jgi:hypothetical protein